MRVTSVDVSVMNIGGADVLADLKNVKCVSSVDLADGTTIGQFGQSPTPLQHRVTLETELLSTTGAPPVRVTGLNITQVKIGGTEYLGNVVSGLFRSSMTMKDGAGVADGWQYPVVTRKSYTADINLVVDSNGPQLELISMIDGALVTVELLLEINGVVISLPVVIERVQHVMNSGEIQHWKVRLRGQAPVNGDYPTTPITTNSLLESAIVQPGILLSSNLASRVTGGVSYSGDFVIDSFGFSFRKGDPIKTKYRLISFGAVSVVTT